MGSVTDQDRPRLGHLSEPCGDADGISRHAVLAVGDHLTRLGADSNRDCDAVALRDRAVELIGAFHHFESGTDGALGVVLVYGRDSEERGDRVARMPLEPATPARENVRYCFRASALKRAEPLWLKPLPGPVQLSHEDRRELPLLVLLELVGARLLLLDDLGVETRVLVQDLSSELLEGRPRIDAEPVDKRCATLLEGMERVGLTATAIEREHQLASETFSEGIPGYQRLELADEFAMTSQCEVGLDTVFARAQPQLLEASDLVLRERLVM